MAPERAKRRLSAILATDVANYSRLMGVDEEGTLVRMKRHRSDLIDPKIAEHRGRIVKTTGDGMLVEFASVVDAGRCALDIQRGMIARNAKVGDDERIEFRIGINVGDIIVDGGDIFGDGVNIAARLEAIADPGGICVSGRAHEDMEGRLDASFEDQGEQQLKNIARPVRVYRARLAGGEVRTAPTLLLPAKPSIAVLPFQNISGDQDQEYFTDGMVEDITSGLSRFKWLFVIARKSTLTYKGRAVDVRQVGRELGVRYALEGSVRKAAGRVRITTQLVEAENRTHIWADRYDRAMDDIFALQDEITVSTVAAIEPSLRQAEIERAKRKRPENLDAYDLVLRAMPFYETVAGRRAEGAAASRTGAGARARLCRIAWAGCGLHEFLYVRNGRREENRLAAIRHGRAAIALGPDDAAALTYGGIAIGMVEHDRALAKEAFETALAISPSASWAYLWGSLILGWGGQAEQAIEWGERGIRLSPFDPWISAALHGIFLGHFLRERYEEAATAARRAIRAKPGFSISHMMSSAALARLGRLDEAKTAAQRVLALQPNFSRSGQCEAVGAVPELAKPFRLRPNRLFSDPFSRVHDGLLVYDCTFIQEGDVDVATWLRGIGLGQYEKAFCGNDISEEVLAHLTAEDLTGIGVTSVGHRRKLLDAIASLALVSRSAPIGASASLKTALPLSAPTEAERRQLTVMFVDLVGSTELSHQLDPEELRAVIRRYRSAVTEEVDRFGGHVAKFLGDGILAYFGWPKAQEDAAERAIKAALRIVAAAGGIKTQEVPHLRARIGIATGLVVIGSLGGGEAERPDEIVGETPNLAARLQQAAGPDQVVISETTRHLVGGIFDLEDLGRQPIKGIGPSVALWRVHGIGRSESRFEGLHGTMLTPFVGRGREIDLLLERWGRVRRTMGQFVLVTGEPGIGKSRLVRFLGNRLRGDRLQEIHFDASPYYANSALRPVISEIRRSAEFASIDPDETQLRKLELLLGRALSDTSGAIPVIADLLGVRTGEQHSLRDLTPQQRKAMTFAALLNWVEGLATRHPLLVVVEDAQWLDPTTLELVDRINDRIAQLPVLLVVTFRPEFKPAWSGAHVDWIVLERLDPIEAVAVAEAVAGKRLPQEVLNEIVAHTDGIPLFIEELTKAMRDLNVLVDAGDHFDLLGSLPAVTVPVTLQDALMARLDRLPPSARHAAQVGAVIGREFDRALLASVSDMPAGELETALSELIGAELILSGGTAASPAHIFKHALIQDAAYESLLKRRRRELHGAIADALVNRFMDTATAHPELVAGHYGRAGLVEQAVPYYQAAARTAIMRSATREALDQLDNGLSLLETLPEGLERNRFELGLRLALGDALRAARGTAAVETGTAYARARYLAGQTGAEHENLRASYGEFLCYYNRAELDRAREAANELMRAAARAYGEGGPIGVDAAGFVALWMGDFATARSFLEQRVSTRAPDLDPLLGADIADAGPNLYLARTLLILGYPEQGYRRCRQGLETAEKTRQPFAIVLALANTCVYYHLCKDWLALRRDSERLIALASEKAMPAMLNKGRGFRAAALIAEGNATEGLETLKSCYEHDVNAGYLVMMPYYESILAEAYLSSGNVEDARRVLDDAFERATSTGERWFDAELYRLKGEFALREPGRDGDLAAESFGKSVETAGAQAAKWWELRAATQLARLWAERGAGEKAHGFLTPVRDWFTEGFETADVREAEALLSELERATLYDTPSARRE